MKIKAAAPTAATATAALLFSCVSVLPPAFVIGSSGVCSLVAGPFFALLPCVSGLRGGCLSLMALLSLALALLFSDYFAWNKENGKNWDHWVGIGLGTVLICQGNTFRWGR